MYGNLGMAPCVCQPYRVIRPLGPSEQLTTVRERLPSSYPVSYETVPPASDTWIAAHLKELEIVVGETYHSQRWQQRQGRRG
jgi:hypothetical protein